MEAQYLCAGRSTAPTPLQRFRSWARAGALAVLRLRAMLDRRRRRGKSPAHLSPGARHRGPTIHRRLLPADDHVARCAWELAAMAHPLFFRRRSTRGRTLAWFVD